MKIQLQNIIDRIEAGQFKEAYYALKLLRKDPALIKSCAPASATTSAK